MRSAPLDCRLRQSGLRRRVPDPRVCSKPRRAAIRRRPGVRASRAAPFYDSILRGLCSLSSKYYAHRLELSNFAATGDLYANSKRMPKVTNPDQTADHNNETNDRRESSRAPAPTSIYPRLDDYQIEKPGHDREDFKRSRLPLHMIARVGVPEAIDDS